MSSKTKRDSSLLELESSMIDQVDTKVNSFSQSEPSLLESLELRQPLSRVASPFSGRRNSFALDHPIEPLCLDKPFNDIEVLSHSQDSSPHQQRDSLGFSPAGKDSVRVLEALPGSVSNVRETKRELLFIKSDIEALEERLLISPELKSNKEDLLSFKSACLALSQRVSNFLVKILDCPDLAPLEARAECLEGKVDYLIAVCSQNLTACEQVKPLPQPAMPRGSAVPSMVSHETGAGRPFLFHKGIALKIGSVYLAISDACSRNQFCLVLGNTRRQV